MKKTNVDITRFETGAIRDSQAGKNNWTETISWTALNRYATYMTGKRAKYGAGNFKKGIPITSYEESIPRHWHKYFTNKYEGNSDEPNEDHLAAIIFNCLGIMHEEEAAKKKITPPSL
jgi:hypothetical protein